MSSFWENTWYGLISMFETPSLFVRSRGVGCYFVSALVLIFGLPIVYFLQLDCLETLFNFSVFIKP